MADGLPQTNKIVRESRELERARERERARGEIWSYVDTLGTN